MVARSLVERFNVATAKPRMQTGTTAPLDRSGLLRIIATDYGDLRPAAGEVRAAALGIRMGHESVKVTVVDVFGEVDMALHGVEVGFLVLDHTQRRCRYRQPVPRRVSLVNQTFVDVLAGQPSALERRTTGAVVGRVGADGRAVDQPPIGSAFDIYTQPPPSMAKRAPPSRSACEI